MMAQLFVKIFVEKKTPFGGRHKVDSSLVQNHQKTVISETTRRNRCGHYLTSVLPSFLLLLGRSNTDPETPSAEEFFEPSPAKLRKKLRSNQFIHGRQIPLLSTDFWSL